MRKILGKLILSVLIFGSITAVASADEPQIVPTLFHTAYIPNGFDSNDNIQFVGEGIFRNSCYKPAEAEVSVDHVLRKIFVGPRAFEYSGICLQVLLPFNRVVNVGLLREGAYEIIQNSDGTKLGTVAVVRSLTANPDDYLYAPISQAFFAQKGKKKEIILTGEFTNSCMEMREIRMSVQSNVVVVMPIAGMREGANCRDGSFLFKRRISAGRVPAGRFLLHVRSMNAQAVNSLVVVR